jgi:hypothetical protein
MNRRITVEVELNQEQESTAWHELELMNMELKASGYETVNLEQFLAMLLKHKLDQQRMKREYEAL